MNHSTAIKTNDSLAVRRAIFNAATRDASASMSRWTGCSMQLRIDEVYELPVESVVAELNMQDEPLAMVALALEGEQGGTLLLTFDEQSGRALAAALLGRQPASDSRWSELEISALCETGNILACAYLGALTRFTEVNLVPSPPIFMHDYVASALEQAMLMHASGDDAITIARTSFSREGEQLAWNVFFLPNAALCEALQTPVVNA